jgi:magnesium chelatase family protein
MQGIHSNAQMNSALVRKICLIDEKGEQLLKVAMQKLGLSARAYDRILKVARTIADLAGAENILIEHLAEAIQYRSLDRENWGA